MTKRKPSPLDGLRTAAHLRHAAVVASAWWWCPPIMMARLARHADVVDDFYDELEGGKNSPADTESAMGEIK